MTNLVLSLYHQSDKMKYYYILPNALIGYIFFDGNINPRFDNIFPSEKIKIVLNSDISLESNILRHSFYTIVSKPLKNAIEKSHLSGFSFKIINEIIKEYKVDENGPLSDYRSYADDYWLLVGSHYSTPTDFTHWKGNLVVSETALNFLYEQDAFIDNFEGTSYGDKHKLLTNKFLLEGNIDDYFNHQWPIISHELEEKRKLIMQEYRRRNGLPPLP